MAQRRLTERLISNVLLHLQFPGLADKTFRCDYDYQINSKSTAALADFFLLTVQQSFTAFLVLLYVIFRVLGHSADYHVISNTSEVNAQDLPILYIIFKPLWYTGQNMCIKVIL